MLHTTHSLEETKEVAQKFVQFLSELKTKAGYANVFGFSGDLGSGKTTFTKSVAEILGITEHVTSPTFVIEKKYPISEEVQQKYNISFKTLIHIDAYRLESARELEVLNFLEDCEEGEVGADGHLLHTNLILIEWPERVLEILPKNTQIIQFSFVDEHVRTIKFPDMMTV
jgi:tRNA threonylcarbamoyladenosine biosynthesis protein TsaE